jgi:hypothetical protein
MPDLAVLGRHVWFIHPALFDCQFFIPDDNVVGMER